MESLIMAYAKQTDRYWATDYKVTRVELRGEAFDIDLHSECGYYAETETISVIELLDFMWSRIGGDQ